MARRVRVVPELLPLLFRVNLGSRRSTQRRLKRPLLTVHLTVQIHQRHCPSEASCGDADARTLARLRRGGPVAFSIVAGEGRSGMIRREGTQYT